QRAADAHAARDRRDRAGRRRTLRQRVAARAKDRGVPTILLRWIPPLPRRLRSPAAGARAAESGSDRFHDLRIADGRLDRLRHTISGMKRLLFLAIFIAAAVDARVITEKDLFRFQWIGDPQLSPDASQIAFVRVT